MSKILILLVSVLIAITTTKCASISLEEKLDSNQERISSPTSTTSTVSYNDYKDEYEDNLRIFTDIEDSSPTSTTSTVSRIISCYKHGFNKNNHNDFNSKQTQMENQKSNDQDFVCPDILETENNLNLTISECCRKYKPLMSAVKSLKIALEERFRNLDIEIDYLDDIDPSNFTQVFSKAKPVCNQIIRLNLVSSFKDVNIANLSLFSQLGLEYSIFYSIHDFCMLVADKVWGIKIELANQTSIQNKDRLNTETTNNSTHNVKKMVKRSTNEDYDESCLSEVLDPLLVVNKLINFFQIKQYIGSFNLADMKDLDKFYNVNKKICEKVVTLPEIMAVNLKNLPYITDVEKRVLGVAKIYCGIIIELPDLIINANSFPYLKLELETEAERYRSILKNEFEKLKASMVVKHRRRGGDFGI